MSTDQVRTITKVYKRYYYPSIGRFINEDPIGLSGGINMYGFVGNNPINMIDPLGLHYAEDYRELLDKWDEAFNKYKEIIRRAKVERIEYDKYCPTWNECYKNCMFAALFSGVESWTLFGGEVITNIFFWLTKGGNAINLIAVGRIITQSITLGGTISAAGVSAYCAIHCAINKRAY